MSEAVLTVRQSDERTGRSAGRPGWAYRNGDTFAATPTRGEWLLALDDVAFVAKWLAITDEQKADLRERERFACVRRYVEVTGVGRGLENLDGITPVMPAQPEFDGAIRVRLTREDIDAASAKPQKEHREKNTARPDADATLEHAVASVLTTSGASEDAVALAFCIENRDRLRFNHRRRCWHVWDGTRWLEERTRLAFEYARRVARKSIEDGKATNKAAFVRGVETFAQSDRAFAMVGDEFDRDPMLLNTPAGTIDLRTGETRPHCQADLLTKSTSVAPSNAKHPAFSKFMLEIACGDTGLIDYLQRALGACLSGAQSDHWLMFWYGAGRNGKNTLGEIVMHIMGDYARKIPARTLMHDNRGEGHPTEIANLVGARLALSSEIAEGDYWHESRIKELTGDKMLSARFMRQDFFEFPRSHKHLVYGNHRPMLRVVDPAIAERLHMVPFNATFTAELGNLDPDMPDRLREEAGAILRWLLEGHAKWREDGTLKPCKAVADTTKDYLESQSSLDAWIRERCEIVRPDERDTMLLDPSSHLYKDYSEWKDARGEHALSQTRWGEQMGRRFEKVKASVARYRGIRLLSRE